LPTVPFPKNVDRAVTNFNLWNITILGFKTTPPLLCRSAAAVILSC
jgi:hypothetical protein